MSGDGSRPPTLIECGVIRTRARDPLPERLREIHEGVTELIARRRELVRVATIGAGKPRRVCEQVVLGRERAEVEAERDRAVAPLHQLLAF